uniref:PiggyBac transposable element-derived protein domain-containing protein n=1 Tax=Clastoptera arizonana TaxID=38151 RepID=A0A1B6E438_9HEMI
MKIQIPNKMGKILNTKWKLIFNLNRYNQGDHLTLEKTTLHDGTYTALQKKAVRTRRANIIIHLPGVKAYAKNARTALECWELFFGEDILNIIVTNTNMHIAEETSTYTRERRGKPTDVIETKALFGLLYLAGLLKSSRLNTKDLWDREGCGIERFWLTMSQDRFLFLLKHLRFDSNATRMERKELDKFTHVREMFDLFTTNCKKSYTVGEHVTVDEMLLGFRGRCRFRQYMPSKPNKYGLKIFALVDARTHYMLNWEPYLGIQPDGPYKQDNSQVSLVLRLISPISGTGRNVTTDNFFTSFPLIDRMLHEHRLTIVGTVRKNKRELPPEFVNTKQRPVGSSLFGFQENVTIVSYVPKKGKNVLLASSMHYDDTIDETTGDANKPEIITYYNSTKGGVDTLDELCATYDVARNTRRWPMVMLFAMLNVAGVNSQIIFSANNPTKKKFRRVYLKELASELTSAHVNRRSLLTNLPPEIRKRRQEVAGTSIQAENVDQFPPGTRRRCYLCKKDSKTKYSCKYCLKFICLSHAQFACTNCNATIQ